MEANVSTNVSTTLLLNAMMIGFTIIEADYEKDVCKLRVVTEDINGKSVKTLSNVRMSGIVKYRLTDRSEKNYYPLELGVNYVDTCMSSSLEKNPLKLHRYVDKDSGKVAYGISMVFERAPKRYNVVMPNGSIGVRLVYRYHNKNNYVRYKDFVKAEVNS